MKRTRVADRYTLDREIGRGGSGSVWLARDEVLGRIVALKRTGFPIGTSASDLARAEREARLAARVTHPNVTAVYDFLSDGDQQWLVMEYVEGTTLAAIIRERGRLTPDEAAPLLAQAAEALAAAHALDVVHRDVKPSNILVSPEGTVKLTDFGIARGLSDATLTQTGLVTGSPAYLSPEVATGSRSTPASDVWSFGATLFHALDGKPPYQVDEGGNAVLAVLYRIAHEPPPHLEGGGWLGPLVATTMVRDPEQRPSMADVAAQLHRASEGRAPSGVPTPTDPTAVMSVGPPPAPIAPTSVAQVVRPTRSSEPGGRTPWRIAMIGAAVVIVLAAIGGLLLFTGGDEPDPSAAPNQGATTEPTGSQSATDSADRPTAEDLEDFATDYVRTASRDPDAGFAMLTPAYQAQSPDYEQFWGAMRNPRLLQVQGDPDNMSVTYTYRYRMPGVGTRTETVTLQLVQDGDQLLIAGAEAS